MPVEAQNDTQSDKGNSLHAALGRTATRAVALYFARPIRLFRPTKISGWHSLRGHATANGQSINPQYISSLFRSQGFRFVVVKHFVPPMVANAALGTVLWTTYQETSILLGPHIPSSTAVACVSGGISGFCYALLSAPADNMRRVIEGGGNGEHGGWSYAWKEIFRDAKPPTTVVNASQEREQAREVRKWIRDVGDMAGRGWKGWGWACAKDVWGFAAFFTIFDVTRKTATSLKTLATKTPLEEPASNLPRTVHGITLVAGGAFAGLSYELVGRPWDVARKTLQIERVTHHTTTQLSAAYLVLKNKLQQEGIRSFFRDPSAAALHESPTSTPLQRRLHGGLRTLGRVGPWGVAFLLWEVYGPGVS